MRRGSVDVITLGCSKNLVDSEKIMAQFKANGLMVRHDPEVVSAQTVVVNTCGFIGDAQEESIQMILECCELKKAGKIESLYVMGCLSQKFHDELMSEIPEVDGWYGKFDWAEIVNRIGYEWKKEMENERLLTTPPHYAYLKIAEGCNRSCSYCAIPLMTGRYRSRSQEEILDEARILVGQGVKEIQLIAQDLTYWGVDMFRKPAIAELVQRLSDIPGVEWIRLHYGYPNSFPMDLLPVMRERDNVCKYLDIALQHASDSVLKRMHRNITVRETSDLLMQIRTQVPGIHLRTTMMTGFPGETHEEFEQLLEFVREQRFERLGAFAYCEVDGTYSALHFKDDVPQEVKQSRLAKLMKVQQEISGSICDSKIGSEFKVIIDRKEGDYYIGRTEYDSPEVDPEVLITSQVELTPGQFVNVKINSADDFDLYGEVI